MGEHHKRRYKSGTSVDNPFYGGMMVPATLREKPPIEVKPLHAWFALDQGEGSVQQGPDNSSQVASGYRNKNLNSLVSSQLLQADNGYRREEDSHRAQ